MGRFPLINVPPPVAFRYALESPSWTVVWGAKTADGYTRRRPGEAVSHHGSSHEAHSQSDRVASSVSPVAPASNGGCPHRRELKQIGKKEEERDDISFLW